jgi:hypothetical protein
MTSCTPPSPTWRRHHLSKIEVCRICADLDAEGLERAEERRRKAPSSESPTAKESTSRRPSPHGGGHDGLGDDPLVDSGIAVGRIDKHDRELLAGQRAVGERTDLAPGSGPRPFSPGQRGSPAQAY